MLAVALVLADVVRKRRQAIRLLAHFRRGNECFQHGKLEEAIAEFRSALKVDKDEAYIHKALGEALERTGDRSGAIKEFALAYRYSPRDDGLRAKLEASAKVGAGAQIESDSSPIRPGPSQFSTTAESGLCPPRAVTWTSPRYSPRAALARVEGVCGLGVVVAADGSLREVSVQKPIGLGLDQRAIKAVKKWEFTPGTRNGVPVPMRISVEVHFKISLGPRSLGLRTNRQVVKSVRRLSTNFEQAQSLMLETVQLLNNARWHYNWVGIYLLKDGVLELGPYVGKPTEHTRIPLNQGICGAAASTGETLIVANVNADPRYLACSLETRSEIVVPIKRDGRVLGEIDIDSDTPAAFTEEDRKLLEAVAEILAAKL